MSLVSLARCAGGAGAEITSHDFSQARRTNGKREICEGGSSNLSNHRLSEIQIFCTKNVEIVKFFYANNSFCQI